VQHVNVEDGGRAVVGNDQTGEAMRKDDANPMRLVDLMNQAPRCAAISRRTGERCKGPAVRGGAVCRLHGAGGGHGPGTANPAYKHGLRAREWIEMRKEINDYARFARKL
jgi:hypothetical protein